MASFVSGKTRSPYFAFEARVWSIGSSFGLRSARSSLKASHERRYIRRKSPSVISPMCRAQSKTFFCTRWRAIRTAVFFCLLLMCLETT